MKQQVLGVIDEASDGALSTEWGGVQRSHQIREAPQGREGMKTYLVHEDQGAQDLGPDLHLHTLSPSH